MSKRIPQNLNPLELELNSRHLIEASAGTGKTFNITRLYARLILEKKLSVQEILVMTYTRAATEEIKGRVAAFLLEIHHEWRSEKPSEFTQTLIERVGIEEGDALLTSALLSLDEASIFTIHGFCQRVLKQFAVSLNADLELELVTDSTELIMQSVQDYLRVASKNENEFELLASKNWHIPDNFFTEFRTAISSDLALSQVSKADIERDENTNLSRQIHTQATTIQELFEGLQQNKAIFFDAAVTGRKEELARTQEWEILINWFVEVNEHLTSSNNDEPVNANMAELLTTPKEMGDFINGNRFRSSPESKELLEPLKLFRAEIKKWVDKSTKQAEQNAQLAEVLALVKKGIYIIRERIELAKQKAHVVLFDDLISVFANALKTQNANLIEAIRKQFPVALVDEFQDTDRHQYQILDLLYPKADKDSLLLMIGDPKQAIYGFRGGDIFVYLAAKEDADYVWLMDTNWRSSDTMVSGYNRLFWGHSLQEANAREVFGFDIDYEKIKSTVLAKAAKSPLFDPQDARTSMSYIVSSDVILQDNQADNGKRKKTELEQQVLDWSALEMLRLLSDAKIGEQQVVPADIAVLVKDRIEASLVKSSLDAVGLTSVYLSDKTPLFSTPQAIELYRVLDAVLHSTNRSVLVAGANSSVLSGILTKNIPLKQQHVLLADLHADLLHPQWDTLVSACFDFKDKWEQQGIFSLLLSLIKEHYAPLTSPERSLTNMMHLAEAMAKNAVLNKLPEQQLAWLSHQIFDHVSDEEMQLRLESDANLIKIVTQHGSKGLEYPIVFIPFANKYKDPRKRKTSTIQHFKFQDMHNKQSIYQLGATHASLEEFAKQEHAEKMRLLYVAVTRAEYRCYLGVVDDVSNSDSALNVALGIPSEVLNDCKSQEAGQSSLQHWLAKHVFCGNEEHTDIAHKPTYSDSVDKLGHADNAEHEQLTTHSCMVDANQPPSAHSRYKADVELAIPEFVEAKLAGRSAWIVSSFSNLSRFQRNDSAAQYDVAQPNQLSLHAVELPSEHNAFSIEQNASSAEETHAGKVSVIISQSNQAESAQAQAQSDPASEDQYLTEQDSSEKASEQSSMAIRYQLKKGADTGNLLHDILENVDFHSPDWASASSVALSKFEALEQSDISALFAWLDSCLNTPLSDEFCLADLSLQQTLREAEFYFPMPNLKVREVAKVLKKYRLHVQKTTGFPALTMSMANIPQLSGMMHGFIDLIFEQDGKYYVADYKSTHLGESPQDYTMDKLHKNNQHHLYDLQYLLYSLALHKYLKQQVGNYTFEEHFGGVYYLYLRGMSPEYQVEGKSTGVFFDKVDSEFIELLDTLFSSQVQEV